jgi:hypothetical protein
VINYGRQVDLIWKLGFPFLISGAALIAIIPTALSGSPNAYFHTDISFFIALGLIVVVGICNAIITPALYGTSGAFPQIYMQACMAGNGVVGLLTVFVNGITYIAFKPSSGDTSLGARGKSTEAFFSLAAIVCAVAFLVFKFLEYNKFAISKLQSDTVESIEQGQPSISGSASSPDVNVDVYHEIDDNQELESPKLNQIDRTPLMNQSQKQQSLPYGPVIQTMKPHVINVVLNFTLTFLSFPGMSIYDIPDRLKLSNDVNDNKFWFSLLLLLVFNIFDVLGRFLPNLYLVNGNHLVYLVLSRLVLYPLFLLMSSPLIVFESVPLVIVCVAIFALSNGYCATCSMIHGPMLLHSQDRKFGSELVRI